MTPLSICQATTVFLDFTTVDVSSNAIEGSTPIVGETVWEGDSGEMNGGINNASILYGDTTAGAPEATPYSIYTDCSGRTMYVGFAARQALGTEQELTVSFYIIDFGANWNTNNGGYAGVSLYTGFTSANTNGSVNAGVSEQKFVGEPYGTNQFGLDRNITGNEDSGNTIVPATASFTYLYDTGDWKFTTDGGANLSGTGLVSQAYNAVRIANGGGGDFELNSLIVDIGPVGAPVITQQPAPAIQTLFAGQTASISVQVIGNAPLTNTWFQFYWLVLGCR